MIDFNKTRTNALNRACAPFTAGRTASATIVIGTNTHLPQDPPLPGTRERVGERGRG
jgi:hypothetical protein